MSDTSGEVHTLMEFQMGEAYVKRAIGLISKKLNFYYFFVKAGPLDQLLSG